MPSPKSVFSLEEYALSVLEQLDLADMDKDQRAKYLPRIVHNIEYRLGAALLPLVPDSEAGEFQRLLDTDADAKTWTEFWQRVVPNFKQQVQKVLENFSLECQQILA